MCTDLKLILFSINILIIALITQNMKFTSFLPQSLTQKESVFSFKLLNNAFHVQTDHNDSKQFLRWMPKILCSRVVMKRKPHVSF